MSNSFYFYIKRLNNKTVIIEQTNSDNYNIIIHLNEKHDDIIDYLTRRIRININKLTRYGIINNNLIWAKVSHTEDVIIITEIMRNSDLYIMDIGELMIKDDETYDTNETKTRIL